MKRGHDGIWRTVGGVPVSAEQQKKLDKTTGWTEVLNKRSEQADRVIKSLSHLPLDRQIAIILMWMSTDEVEEMLKTLEK